MSELNVGEATAELLKELTDEIRRLNTRIETLEQHNNTMMRKAGWLRAITPMADEVFDPLNRTVGDNPSFASGFNTGDGALIKSPDAQLREWEQMEASMPPRTSPSSRNYR